MRSDDMSRVEAVKRIIQAPTEAMRDDLWPLTETESWCAALLLAFWLGVFAGLVLAR